MLTDLATSSNELLRLSRIVKVKAQVRMGPKGPYKVKAHIRHLQGPKPKTIDEIVSVKQAEEWLQKRWPKSDLSGMTHEDVPGLRGVLRAVEEVVKEFPHVQEPPDGSRKVAGIGSHTVDRQFRGVMTWEASDSAEVREQMSEGTAWATTGGEPGDTDSIVFLSTGETFRSGLSYSNFVGYIIAENPYEGMVHELAHVVQQTGPLTNFQIERATEDAFGSNAIGGAISSQYANESPEEAFAEVFLVKRSKVWSGLSDRVKKRVDRFLNLTAVPKIGVV